MSAALRVAVTRDEGPDGDLSRALRARGLEPVRCAAVTQREAPDAARLIEAARRLEDYDWLIVASARALDALIVARGGRALPAGLRTATVGDRTAARLIAAGAEPAPVVGEAGASALITALRDEGPWPGRRCLLPRALDGGTALGEALRSWGATAEEVVAYRTEPCAPAEIAAAWEAAAPDAAVIASPSAASALVGAIGAPALRRLRVVVAIGPTTHAALASRGIESVTPPHSDFEAAAELLRGLSPSESEDSR